MRSRSPQLSNAALALGLEAALGYPDALYSRIGHPVGGAAAIISALEQRLNRPELAAWRRRLGGIVTVGLTAAAGAGFGLSLEQTARLANVPFLAVALATPGLAQRSLYDHVQAVNAPLIRGDLGAARRAVSRIVGRDVDAMGETEIVTAALESLAESFGDGVVAPAFWLAIGGLPALYAYKALNTADSLIGHWEPRWRDFGWAAARADDLANLVPARLAGALIALAGGGGWRTMWRDAPKHASPNAGWPEAAMAGALAVRLGGPATYDGAVMRRPVFNDDGASPRSGDIAQGLEVYRRACLLLVLSLALGGLVARRRS